MGKAPDSEQRRRLDSQMRSSSALYGGLASQNQFQANSAQNNSNSLYGYLTNLYGGGSSSGYGGMAGGGATAGYGGGNPNSNPSMYGMPSGAGGTSFAGYGGSSGARATGQASDQLPGGSFPIQGPGDEGSPTWPGGTPITGGGGRGFGGGQLNTFMSQNPNSSGWFDLPNDGGGYSSAGGDFGLAKKTYGDFAETGGMNSQDFNDARSGYGDFARTGGVDATALRQRATAQIPSFYDAFKRQSQTRNNVQGGYGPGFDQQQLELARQAGREGFNASRQVEGDIADKVQAGRMYGISGQAGLGQLGQQGRLAGASGLTNIGGMEQQNNQFNAGLGESRNARNLGAQMTLAQMYQQGGQFSAGQMQNLYGMQNANYNSAQDRLLAGAGGLTQAQLNALQLRQGTGGSGINWGAIAGAAGAAAGAASDRSLKENIEPVNDLMAEKFKRLQISTWNYKGDSVKHVGPMAQDFQEVFGVGDGRTIALVDVMGVLLLLGKELAARS